LSQKKQYTYLLTHQIAFKRPADCGQLLILTIIIQLQLQEAHQAVPIFFSLVTLVWRVHIFFFLYKCIFRFYSARFRGNTHFESFSDASKI